MTSLMVALVAVGCQSSPLEPASGVTDVEILPAELQTAAGAVAHFQAIPRDASGRAVAAAGVDWSTSDPSVAIVDAGGYVWAFKEGSTTATASAPGKGNGSSNGNAYGHAKKQAQVEVTSVAPDRPGRVSDLSVSSKTAGSVTLSFTEVDDGLDGPADYLIRFQIAPIDWGTAANVIWGSCAVPMAGTGVGSRRTCTVERLAAATSYEFQVIAFRGTLSSDAVYGDLSNVTAATTDAPPEPTLAGGGDAPNEPSGYSLISARGFNEFGEGDWTDAQSSLYEVGITDSGAPTDRVARVRFRSGMTGGVPPVNPTGLRFVARPELYIGFWIKFDDEWQGHDSGVNKILFVTDDSYGGGGDPAYVAAYGVDGGSLNLQIRLQGPGNEKSAARPNGNLPANTGDGELLRGRWHHVELRLVMNTGTNFDGQAHAWIDGRKVIEYRDVKFEDSETSAHRIQDVRWSPIWGGMGDTVQSDMYMLMDELRVSGS